LGKKNSKRKKKTKNPKKLEKEADNVEKNEHGNNVTNHTSEAFVITTLSMYRDETYYVNSNAPMHLYCHKRNWVFEFEFERISPIKIYMGNNSTQKLVGKGKIKIKMIVGTNMILTMLRNNIIYILGLNNNLFSMCKATSQVYSTEFSDDVCQVKNN
jgi:hypothetical protein